MVCVFLSVILCVCLSLRQHHGSSSALPAVVSVAFGRECVAAQEHRSLRCALQQNQRPGSRAEAVPGQDPRVQLQEQVC